MKRFLLTTAFLLALVLPMAGCGDDSGKGKDNPKPDTTDTKSAGSHSHAAPHGGHLIELGNDHSIHAELKDAHDLGGVVIYMLDGDMKPMKIDQDSVILILSKADDHKEFVMKAQGDKPADVFLSKDSALHDMMHGEGVTGKLKATIKGKQYNGKVDLSDHSGHDH